MRISLLSLLVLGGILVSPSLSAASSIKNRPLTLLSASDEESLLSLGRTGRDLIVLKDGTELTGDISHLPSLHYFFGEVELNVTDVAVLAFVEKQGHMKMHALTRVGDRYRCDIPRERISLLKEYPTRKNSRVSASQEIDLHAIDYVVFRSRDSEALEALSPGYTVELKNGDMIPARIVSESVKVSDGWKEFSVRTDALVEVRCDGGLRGSVLGTDGIQKDLDLVFVVDPDLQVVIPSHGEAVHVPWDRIAGIKTKKRMDSIQPLVALAAVDPVPSGGAVEIVGKREEEVTSSTEQELTEENAALKSQAKEWLALCDQFLRRVQELQDALWKEKERACDSTADLTRFEAEKQKAAQEMAAKDREIDTLRRSLAEKEERVTHLGHTASSQNEALAKRLFEMTALLDDQKKQNQSLLENLQLEKGKNAQFEAAQAANAVDLQELDSLKKQNEELAKEKIQKYDELVASFEGERKAALRFQRGLEEKQKALKEANDKAFSLQKELITLKEVASSLEKNYASARQSAQDAQARYEQLVSEHSAAAAKWEERNQAFDTAEKEMLTHIVNLQGQLEAAEAFTASLQNSLQLQREGMVQQQHYLETIALARELDRVGSSERLALLESTLSKEQSDAAQFQQQLTLMLAEYEREREETRALRKENNAQRAGLEVARKEIAQAERLLRDLEQEVQTLTTGRTTADREKETLSHLLEDTANQNLAFKENLNSLKEIINRLESEKRIAEQRLAELQQVKVQLDEAHNGLANAEKKNRATLGQLDAITRENQHLIQDNSHLVKHLDREKMAVAEQKQIVKRLTDTLNMQKAALMKIERSHLNLVSELENAKQLQTLFSEQVFVEPPEMLKTGSVFNAARSTVHIVAKGENLNNISMKYYGTPGRWRDIYEANSDAISDINRLSVGAVLVIPDYTQVNSKFDLWAEPKPRG